MSWSCSEQRSADAAASGLWNVNEDRTHHVVFPPVSGISIRDEQEARARDARRQSEFRRSKQVTQPHDSSLVVPSISLRIADRRVAASNPLEIISGVQEIINNNQMDAW
jgi:hypothetical protein